MKRRLGNMKRYIVNAVALLVIVGIGFAAANGYAKPALVVGGTTQTQKALSIADNVNKEYGKVVVVTRAGIATNETSGRYIRYSMRIVVSETELMSQPTTREEASKQAEMNAKFLTSISKLLELSTIHLLNQDPTLNSVSILIIFPDDTILQTDVTAAQLRAIGKNPKASAQEWFASAADSVKSKVMVDEELWNKIKDFLEQAGQPVPSDR